MSGTATGHVIASCQLPGVAALACSDEHMLASYPCLFCRCTVVGARLTEVHGPSGQLCCGSFTRERRAQ
jgi:hypothetical protein